MVYYYKTDNGIYLAKSSRGIFIYDVIDDMWYPAGKLYSTGDLEKAQKISYLEFDKARLHKDQIRQQYKNSIYLTRIAARNGIGVKAPPEYYESFYINSIPVIAQLINGRVLTIDRPVTFFVGENGAGKSTILEAIAVGFGLNGEGGDQYFEFETKRTHSHLSHLIQLGRVRNPKDAFFLRAESFYNLASAVDDGIVQGNFGGSLHERSHGESFMALIKNRFYGNGLYILDEPEAALSPKRIMDLMKEMKRLIDNGSQFIIATHSPILMTFPDAQIYECTMKGIYDRRYQELESFMLYRDFLNNPEYSLRQMGL